MNLGKYEINNIYNEDCYEALKNLPDKCIDLVYIDPPYQFCQGGKGHSEIGDRKDKNKGEIYSLDTDITKRKIGTGYTSGGGCFGTKKRDYHSEIQQTDVNLTPQRKAYLDYVSKYGKDDEAERLRVIANAVDNRENTYFISKGFSNEISDELCRILKKIYIYIWCNKEQLRQIFDYFDDKGCHLDLLTWHKTNPIPTCNNTYLSDTEYLVLARESGCKIYGTVETKHKYYVSQCNVADKELFKHPTCKPTDLMRYLVRLVSPKDATILDCFNGSGSTGKAVMLENKQYNKNYKYIGIELTDEYLPIAKARIEYICNNEFDFWKDENGKEQREVKNKDVMTIFDFTD